MRGVDRKSLRSVSGECEKATLPAVVSPVAEVEDMDLADGGGKQLFTVEICSLVDSICDKVASVLSLFR